jgi:hypothetical protein
MKKTVIDLCVTLIVIGNMTYALQCFSILTLPLWVYILPYAVFLLLLLFFYIKK